VVSVTEPYYRILGFIVGVPGYISRGPCSIPGVTRFSET
jgi:hypothetical protein